MAHTMSERLKETLGILEERGHPVQSRPSGVDEDGVISGSNGGAVIPWEPKDVKTNIPESEDHSDIRDDYITSRNITHALIGMAGEALNGALSVAVETQHPKAYSVFNELATTMRGLSKDLLDMQKIFKEITAEKIAKQKAAEEAAKTVNNNSVNITTTASLAEVLKMMKEGKIPMPQMPETVDG